MNALEIPAMKIRAYRPSDLESVVAIFHSNIPKYFTPEEEPGLQAFLGDYAEDYYIVEVDGEVVASGGIAYNDLELPTVSLCWGMVRKDFLGKGLGKELTKFRIDLSRKKYPGLPLTIGTSEHTQGFYEKFGFRLTDHAPDGFGRGIDSCKMRLEF
jgi:predicted GNAT family N-acyltransferase